MRRSDEFNACDYRSRHMAVQEFAVYKMKIVWLTSDLNCSDELVKVIHVKSEFVQKVLFFF